MRYLITGGAGFIGSHLADVLLGEGHEIVVLDNFSTGRRENLLHHFDSERILVIEGSILDERITSMAVEQVDRVLHFAATVGVFNIMKDPLGSLRTNIRGTENVLDNCAKFGKPVLIASSSEIYGKNASNALAEDSDRIIGAPQKIRWSYSDSKAIDESFAISLNQGQGLETRIVRLFNTVGPRQVGHYGMVVPRFVEAALKNQPLEVYGTGTQTRCFGHISDITSAILKLDRSKDAVGRPVNVGVDKEVSIFDLATFIIEETNSNSVIHLLEYERAYPPGYEDMARRVPDNSLLRRLTGWSPKKDLVDIVRDIKRYHEAKLN
jgi:UDP-glucose 4-epimerase